MTTREEAQEAFAPYWASRPVSQQLAVADGWLPIVVDALEEIVAVAPDTRVLQVKEKLGSLRLYVNSPDPTVSTVVAGIVRRAEAQAVVTCETCGQGGRLGGKEYAWSTSCDADAPAGWEPYDEDDEEDYED